MKVIAEVPHKILFSGAYTILDGCPALALAVGPRMTLKLVPQAEVTWPRHNPFAKAVREEITLWLEQRHRDLSLDSLVWGEFRSHVSMPIEGWGVGSSASFTTALVLAQMTAFNISMTPEELFTLARRAHRRAQGGKGSGIDIAACAYGEVVRVAHAECDDTPSLTRMCWPADVGVLLLRSGQKADTRDAITAYFGASLSRRRELRRPLMRAVGQVCRSLLRDESQFLPALQENALQEEIWSESLDMSLIIPLQKSLEEAFGDLIRREWVAIKSLGAGGGDSIGCFYRTDQVSIADLMERLQDFPIQVRPATIQRKGATLLSPPSPFLHAPDLRSPCADKHLFALEPLRTQLPQKDAESQITAESAHNAESQNP